MNQFIGKQFDEYQIGPLLGEGGMGAVFHAHDLKNNRPVALKIMLANLTNKPHFQQRFRQEAEICAAFNSPAIVKIYGNGTVDGHPYMAMEYIEGGSLAHYVNQVGWGGNKLPLDEVLALSAQIAEGLAYAHQRGLVHRDIKPDNILLKLRDGATGSPRQAVISDFGLAVQLKTADDAATNPFMGSLAYMSPEQCENSGLDGRSDIYALGIVLYELTTGQLPFQINAPADIVKHIHETPLPPRLINPDLPQAVEDIILKAIAKKPNKRYQTAAEMAHALRQLAADETLLTAVPLESQNAVTQWLENRWVASVNVQDRVDTSKTWTSDGRYRLFITSQHEESEIHGLNKPVITIGRSADNDIVLEDRTISAHHTSLSMNDNGWLARDLGSTNGSYLGDRALTFNEDVHWNSDEVLRIGPYHLKWQLFSGDGEQGSKGAGAMGMVALGAAAMGTAAVGAAVIANGSGNNEIPVVDFDGGTAVSSSENLSVAITPETAVLEPDVELPINITISNSGVTVQEVSIRLFDDGGKHPIWIRLDENRVKLLPEESASVTAIANLPADFHMDAGKHRLNVQATSDRGESETAVITLARPDSELFTLDIHPSNLQEDVLCRLTIRDDGNFANAYTIMGIDDADSLLFDFKEPQNGILSDFDTNQQTIKVAAQSEASTSFMIRPKKRPLFGNDKPYPFKIRVRTETADWQTLTGLVDIHSRISRRLIIFLMLLTMLLCLLGFGVYTMVAADKEEQRLENQTLLDSIGATATAAQAGADQTMLEAENAQATANALAAAGDVEAAAAAQSTADALQFEANAAQAEVNAMQGEIDSLAAVIDVTATPPPPPSDVTLSIDNVDEDAAIGTTIGSFTASTAALFNPDKDLTGFYARNGAKQNVLAKPVRSTTAQSIAYTYSIVGGDVDAFYVDGDVLKTAVLFDYETQDSYDIVVLADNGLGGTLEAGFSIAINDVSDTPVLTISDVAVDEGDETAVLTVLMTGSTQSEVTVDYATSDDSAAAGEDYEEGGDTLTWAAGESGEREIEIALIADDIKEPTETFEVTLEKAVIAIIDEETAVVTISDDDSTPTISIAGAAAAEGDGEAIIIVTMTGKNSEDVTVSYATKDGTASEDSDYSADDGELVWAAGEDGEKEITISFEDDEMNEPDETLTITLSDAVNGMIGTGTATVTIEDDDDPPTLAIQAAGPFAESAGDVALTVLIEGSSSQAVEVSYATSNDTATAGKDYTSTSGSITWAAESTSAQEIVVPILSDTVYEGEDETFIVTLSNPANATIAVGEEIYAITDDDDQPALSITDVTVDEAAGKVLVVVSMTGGSSTEVTVDYTTVDDTAVADDDYGQTASPPSLSWAANVQDSDREISIIIHDDNFDEGASETFSVNLSNNSDNSILADNSAKVTITDDDTVGIIVNPTSATISEPSATDSFNVRLNSEPSAAVTIPLSSEDDTQCTVPIEVVINASDWNSGVDVTITPIDDQIDESDGLSCDIITGDPTSGDSFYDALGETDVVDVTVTVNDDDTADVLVSPISLTISETTGANTGTFHIELATQPTDDVTIPLESDDTGQCDIDPADATVTLTPSTWNTGVDVVVTAVDEDVIDEDGGCIIVTSKPTGNDSKYTALSGAAIDNVSVTVTNDDAPGATVSPTSLTISETTAAVGESFTIVLGSQPSHSVSFGLSVNNDCHLSDTTVEILLENWNLGGSVTVTAENDAIDDGDSSCMVIIDAASSSDPDYNGVIDPTDVSVTVLDDDETAVLITQTASDTQVTEGGTTDTYNVVLQSEPTGDVAVRLTLDNEVDVGNGAGILLDLQFNSSNWDSVQMVTVTATDDDIDEDGDNNATSHNGLISHESISSGDSNYDGTAMIQIDGAVGTEITAVITDNDTAGVTVIESGAMALSEDGTDDTYTIVLDSEPTFDVNISFSPDSQIQAVGNITFTSSNWSEPITVTMAAVDDDVDEGTGTHNGTLAHTASSSDANYTGISIANVTADITDDDTFGIAQPITSTNITEGGATDSYTFVLESQPESSVTIAFDPGSEIEDIDNMTFTTANWADPQTVTVTAVNDNIAEGTHSGLITHIVTSGGDANYDGYTLDDTSATITDNDNARITITESGGGTAVEEGGTTDSYSIVLESQPTGDVTVAFDTNTGAQVEEIADITFTAVNWNITRTITVTAVDDPDHEASPHSSIITHTASSTDENYDSLFAATFSPTDMVTVNITDDDAPGVIITESDGNTTANEDGSNIDSYDIVLNTRPAQPVTIDFTTNVTTEIQAINSITFNGGNWDSARTIFVSAVDDSVSEGSLPHSGTIVHDATSSDANYHSIVISDVVASITDNDSASVIITESGNPSSTDITEVGGTDTYNIELNSQPSSLVTIAFTTNSTTEIQAIDNITFTTANWDTAQTITVIAVDDDIAEGSHTGTITHTATSTDMDYDNIVITNVVADITDNEVMGITLTESGGGTAVDEGGSTNDSYTLVLDSQPTNDVVISFDTGSQITTITDITFTDTDWDTERTITVVAIDDNIIENDPHSGIITHTVSSSDPAYDGETIPNVDVAITDNDDAGILINESGGSTDVTEGGNTDNYTIILENEPSADVIISFSTNDVSEIEAIDNITFTVGNWNATQTITVIATDDTLDENDHTGTIAHTSTSSDTNYNGLTIPDVTVNITDNEPRVRITESGGNTAVSESGTTDSYTIVLDSQPTGNVTIALDTGSQIQPITNIIFTTANWNTVRTITIHAENDDIDEGTGTHSGIITHTATSGDVNYNGITIVDVTATITDNDTAGVTITEGIFGTGVTEAGQIDTYDIVLDSQPTADVVISFSFTYGQLQSMATITFTASTWDTLQTVTVRAVDDAVPEGAHGDTITHTATSSDPIYHGFTIDPVNVTIGDND